MTSLTRGAFLGATLAAMMATGCASHGISRGWDPDSPVLPLRLRQDAQARTTEGGSAAESLPSSYVVLLPGESGDSGAIVIDRPQGQVVLDEPGMLALDTLTVAPVPDSAAPEAVFTDALEFEPHPPAGFQIYFPSDESEPTAESRSQLEEILQALSDWPAAEIELAAHADRFGRLDHNEDLSRRRAEAIRDALVAAGARADLVEISWHGETKTAVATPDGVREPRNRRVEIRIR